MWTSFQDVTNTLLLFFNCSEAVSDQIMPEIQKFVAFLYDKTSQVFQVNKAICQKFLFAKHDRIPVLPFEYLNHCGPNFQKQQFFLPANTLFV